MSATEASSRPVAGDAPWPASSRAGTIVLAFCDTRAERDVLDAWLERTRPEGAKVDVLDAVHGVRLAGTLAGRDDDPWVLPVRVTWLPRERDGARAARVRDVLALTNPRRPSARAQARILRDEPDRCRVVVGEPARTSDLHRRFRKSGAGDEQFDRFVRRQAVLALARAERVATGDSYKIPRLVSQDLCASARFAEGATKLAQSEGRPPAEVMREAIEYVEEMVAGQSRLAIDLWTQFGRFLSRAYTIDVDQTRLEEMRALNRRHALVFLPSHRSYLDPLVLRPALLGHGFPPNHVLGGINVGFWPIGPWAKRSGYVFIRRSIADNAVYKFALRQYVAYLVRKRFNIEWYIEGGRTRTGKLRPPRYGLLNYLVEGFREGDVDDVYLVPTSIVYDQLYEVGAIAAEEHGAAKSPESVGWLIGYARAQGRGFGKVHVRFGEPLSLREALESAGDDHPVEKVAFEVLHRINRATPVTPISLVTLALLGVEDRALTLQGVRSRLQPLLGYIERRGIEGHKELLLGEPEGVRRTLDALVRHGVATTFEGGLEPVWSISPARHLEAAFYRNGAAHFLVNRAIAELVVAKVAEPGVSDVRGEGWEEALRLRDLLKFEFFFGSKEEFADELALELVLVDPDWAERAARAEALSALLADATPHLAHRVLQSFLEAYAVVAELLAAHDPGKPVDEKAFIKECLGAAQQWRLQKRLRSSASISKELMTNGLKLAANRGLVDPGDATLVERRKAFAAEIDDVVRRLAQIRALALAAVEAELAQ
jgi:glycerol-3-phosphate O-acyltransferase